MVGKPNTPAVRVPTIRRVTPSSSIAAGEAAAGGEPGGEAVGNLLDRAVDQDHVVGCRIAAKSVAVETPSAPRTAAA